MHKHIKDKIQIAVKVFENSLQQLIVEQERINANVQASLEQTEKERAQLRRTAQADKKKLYEQTEKYKTLSAERDKLNRETQNLMTNLNSEKNTFEQKNKKIQESLKETEDIKKQNYEQLKKNRKIEQSYNDKMAYLRDDEQRLRKLASDLEHQKRELDTRTKSLERKEYDLATKEAALLDRIQVMVEEEKKSTVKRMKDAS